MTSASGVSSGRRGRGSSTNKSDMISLRTSVTTTRVVAGVVVAIILATRVVIDLHGGTGLASRFVYGAKRVAATKLAQAKAQTWVVLWANAGKSFHVLCPKPGAWEAMSPADRELWDEQMRVAGNEPYPQAGEHCYDP